MNQPILQVREVSKLFGPHAEQAIPLLKQGYTKERLLKEKASPSASAKSAWTSAKVKFSSLWVCPGAANRHWFGC